MKIKYILPFLTVVLLSGCATTEYYTNPQSAGFGGICENCNRVFTLTSTQLYGGTNQNIPEKVDPTEWGLRKGMTQNEVQSILGKPTNIKDITWNIFWYYPNDRRVEFWKPDKNTDYKLNFCAKVNNSDQAIPPLANITCPYCGRVQDIKMAYNRYVYAVQQQDQQQQAQAQANMGQALVGMAVGMQQAQQQQAIAQQNAANNMAAYGQQMFQNSQQRANQQGTVTNPINVKIRDY